jgi:hypothetical protein
MLGFPGKPPGFSLESLAIRDPAAFDVQRKRDPGQLNFLTKSKIPRKLASGMTVLNTDPSASRRRAAIAGLPWV